MRCRRSFIKVAGGQADASRRARWSTAGDAAQEGRHQPQRLLQVSSDSVQPFNDMKAGRIITFYALLKDNTGRAQQRAGYLCLLRAPTSLTINQSIPTNGCAAVTISAETSDMRESLEELIASAAETAGVVKFEILAG